MWLDRPRPVLQLVRTPAKVEDDAHLGCAQQIAVHGPCIRGPQNEQRSVNIKIVGDHKNKGSQTNGMIKPSVNGRKQRNAQNPIV